MRTRPRKRRKFTNSAVDSRTGRDVESLCASKGVGPSKGIEARDACPATCGKCLAHKPKESPVSQTRVHEPSGKDVRPSRLPYLVLAAGGAEI